jgi:hypothetical protein
MVFLSEVITTPDGRNIDDVEEFMRKYNEEYLIEIGQKNNGLTHLGDNIELNTDMERTIRDFIDCIGYEDYNKFIELYNTNKIGYEVTLVELFAMLDEMDYDIDYKHDMILKGERYILMEVVNQYYDLEDLEDDIDKLTTKQLAREAMLSLYASRIPDPFD